VSLHFLDNPPPFTNLAFVAATACTDDELVEILAAAEDLFVAARDDAPVPTGLVRTGERMTTICGDRDGVAHSCQEKRNAALAFVAAARAYYGQPAGIALFKPPFHWSGYAMCVATSADEVWKAQGRRI
jgi:hypothetical protein